MSIRMLAAIAAMMIWTSVAAQSTDWNDYTSSTDPKDRKLVSEILAMPPGDRCIEHGIEMRKAGPNRRRAALRAFLASGGYIRPGELDLARTREVGIGSTICSVAAAFGRSDAMNVTETAAGRHIQIVYRNFGVYIYYDVPRDTGTGAVTAIQRTR